ncbi:hypothetical protein N7468_010617 [Penicillium chermesinum]|uniref:AAA+ ATPase domain-containing protein n=1 Tax=Penicillium chermesinum TaxID=63820 RepID=A0A9W9T9W3_9EURO|nr:uncharacterized protein N7468_010617 [Penicillium chermesinum]KAJ5214938.1 hypothetical protein N7468_010617 [Penicillium chermesinum]
MGIEDLVSAESIDSVDDSDSDLSQRTSDRRRLNDKKRKYEEACKHFRYRGGLTYIANDLWTKYRRYAIDTPIYVGARNPPGAAAGSEEAQPNSADGSATEKTETRPFRIRLMSEPLHSEMQDIMGLKALNYDHVAPFRAIIPYEQKFRARLKALEEQFAELAGNHPEALMVTLTRPWLPLELAYHTEIATDYFGTLTVASDTTYGYIDLTRILLDGFRALVFLLDNDLADLVRTYHQAQQGVVESIEFHQLWYLFWPGQEIVTAEPDYQVLRVLSVSGGRMSVVPRKNESSRTTVSNLLINCFHFDYDGQFVRPVLRMLSIVLYPGERPVTALEVFPLQYLESSERLRILHRGQRFSELARGTHRRYKGLNMTTHEFRKLEEVRVRNFLPNTHRLTTRALKIDGDVIIDFEMAFRSQSQGICPPEFNRTIQLIDEDEAETNDPASGISYDGEEFRARAYLEFIGETTLLEPCHLRFMEKDHLFLLPARVFGYVLLSRRWYPLSIDLVTEVHTIEEGDYDAFDDLVLPKRHRNIIRALVKTHARAKPSMEADPLDADPLDLPVRRDFDIVRGKGKGLIILLHGAPGVGKTSTAECVAAHTGRPLFPITCGDLGGTTAQEVEQNLEKFFDMAMKWGCVLLLDEADVFLGERIQGNLQQNSLVSVFLRVLEYYSGVLILTTNRVGQFDEAATSRIHCALYYPPFSKKRALEVWQKNVDRLKRTNEASNVPLRFNEKKIMKFAEKQWDAGSRWNGRQIKNAFQTAAALADWDHLKKPRDEESTPELRVKHFEAVVETSNHFESYLTAVRKSDRERARTNLLRKGRCGPESTRL